MKKIYSYTLGALMLVGFVAFAPSAHAAWNDGSLGQDCPTVSVNTVSTGGCAGTSISATPGGTVNVLFYVHNTNVNTANNVVVRLSPKTTGSVTSAQFSGSISSSDNGSSSGVATVTIPSAQTLTYTGVQWYPDQHSYASALPGGQNGSEIFSGGLSLGSIGGYGTCVRDSSGGRDVFCHQGWLMVSFQVSNSVISNPCSIQSFSSSAGTGTISSGSSATLTWNAPNCTNFTLTGGIFNGSSSVTSGVNTGPLTVTTPYTLNATGADGSRASSPTVVTVANVSSLCSITNFYTSTPSVTSGGYGTLNWNSTGCSSVVVSGPNGTVSSSLNGPATVGPLTASSNVYSISGVNSTGVGTTAPQVVITVNSVVTNFCTANLQAYQTSVPQGQTTTLSWTSSNCSYVTISGPNGTISNGQLSGTTQTPPIYGTTTFNLVAGGTNVVNQSLVIYSNGTTNTVPVVTTTAATNSAQGTATLNGYINSNSGCTYTYYNCGGYTNYYFQYGTSQYAMNMQTPTQSFASSSGNVSAYITNLTPNTTYYFQLIGSNSYGLGYGGILSFVSYGNGNANITAVTSIATNVTSSSARLNGVVTAPNGTTGVTAHFEYGTSATLGSRTSDQAVNGYSVINYFDTINTLPSTTYYYRIVGVSNGQIFPGATVSFTTPSAVDSTPVVITRYVGTGGGSAYIMLTITDQAQNVFPGDTINYVVTYKNISGVTLSNAVLNVILPTGVTFRQASQGVLTTNNTVAATLGTLVPQAEGVITINATANQNIVAGTNFVTTATIAFTTPGKAQDSAIAYVLNNVAYQNNLAGLALFGNGFFPDTLLGWIILLLLLLILILIARYFYHRANESKMVAQGSNQAQYNNHAPVNNGYQNHNGYPNNNLPH